MYEGLSEKQPAWTPEVSQNLSASPIRTRLGAILAESKNVFAPSDKNENRRDPNGDLEIAMRVVHNFSGVEN